MDDLISHSIPPLTVSAHNSPKSSSSKRVMRPLDGNVTSSRKLVSVMRDIVNALIYLWRMKMTHRDVAVWSIAVGEDGKGILLDLELSLRDNSLTIPRCEVGHYRSGSFPFLAVSRARHPYNAHDMVYDIESCFWVLAYIAMQKYRNPYYSGEEFKQLLTEESRYSYVHPEVPVQHPITYCPRWKEQFLQEYIGSSVFSREAALSNLFEELKAFFHNLRSLYREYRYGTYYGVDESPYEQLRDQLKLNTFDFLAPYDRALARNDWPEAK